jgi:hypothetical protein
MEFAAADTGTSLTLVRRVGSTCPKFSTIGFERELYWWIVIEHFRV